MSDGATPEGPHDFGEDDGRVDDARRKRRWEEVVEIAEVFFLALVAVATAWSGYESAQWNGQQAELYGKALEIRTEAAAADTRGGQILDADASFLNGWLDAEAAGDKEDVAALYVRRFTPEYRAAFKEWLKTDPLHNPDAPPGPAHMPSFRSPELEQAKALNAQATAMFNQGTASGKVGDTYVRYTVLFASVLFLISISQRFKIRQIRLAALGLALALLAFSIVQVAGLPRL